ncbi:helix-turn-helix transcriptional regulator [Fluviicola sp.]|uniref:AraC family transcriptional regulator n=1 Tax=Fluviicola sp. TaxID=1917219 RepID=UPI0031D27298
MQFPRLPIEKFDENGLFQAFYVNRFSEHLKKYHSDITHPHKHDFYLTVFFQSGKGRHDIDFNAYPIRPNAVFFLQPEQIHHWEFEEDAEGWILFHSEDFYRFYSAHFDLYLWPFFQSRIVVPMLEIDSQTAEKLQLRFAEIMDEYQENTAHSFLKIASLTQLIYSDLSRVYIAKEQQTDSGKNSRYQDHFHRFTLLLNQFYTQHKNPSDYASKLAMTTKHLHRICLACSGKSTSQLIAERLILEAKRKLVSESKSIAEIADELGFENYPYFHLFFKKHCGETPKQFRERS